LSMRFLRDLVARRIAGDIVWSEDPGASMKKWREVFRVSQISVARHMGVAPSVVSDYEKGRRLPGSRFVRRFVESLLEIDEGRGWIVVKELAKTLNLNIEAIIDMAEFEEGVGLDMLVTVLKGMVLASEIPEKKIYGYTVLDSIAAIESMKGTEFHYLMGMTTERALIFTKVTTGRSPMVAVRVSSLKPAVIVVHGPRKRIDLLAVRLAEKERIPFIVSLHQSVEDIVASLRSLASRTG
jgi:putative transcriptional regulator